MPHLTRDPLPVERIVQSVEASGAGAVVVFVGVVRDNNEGHAVIAIEYEAYEEMAEEQLGSIEAEIRELFEVNGVALVHRLGRLQVGEASVVVAVSSPHRGDCFSACRHGIDRIKELVPIWKRELTTSGVHWVGVDEGPDS